MAKNTIILFILLLFGFILFYMSKEMNLLEEYVDRFKQSFPIRFHAPKGKTIDDVIKECLEKNEPLRIEYRDDLDY